MVNNQICGDCLRFEPIIEDVGKCRLLRYERKKIDVACKKLVNTIKIEKDEETGWFVILGPNNERIGPFVLFNDIDCIKIGEASGIKPKEILKASLKVPMKLVEKFDINLKGFKRKALKKIRGKNKEESKEKIVEVSRLITETFIAEEIYDPSDPSQPLPRFAVKYFNKDEIEFQDIIDLGEKDVKGRPIIYTPVFNDHVKKGMVILPHKPVPCTIKEVVEEATAFVFKSFDPCGKDNELKILILIPISSWILDKERPLLPVAGIGVFAALIACRGPSGTGKNRLANLLRFLSYHPLIQLSTYRIPSLYRPLDIWKGTLIMDEADVKNTGATSQLIHFINSRATGTPIGRQNPESPSQCDAFDSFGQTILTQRRHFDDNATEGRTIPYYCDVSEKKIPTLLTKEEILKGYDLQDKLLYIRLKYWDKIKIEKTLWVEKVSDHRLNSILLPIMALAKFDPGLKEIVSSNIATLHEARRRLKAQSDDGVMINVLWEKIESGLFGVHNTLYYLGAERESYKGIDDEELERITPLTTTLLGDSLKRSSRDVRKILTSLNLSPENAPSRFRVGKRSYRGIFFEPKKMEKRLREFVVAYENNELYKVLNISVPDVPDVPQKPSGLLDFASQHEKKPDAPVSGTSGTSGTQIEKEPKTLLPSQMRTPNVQNTLTDFNIIECIRLDDPSVGKCANCKDTETLTHQVENTKKEFGFVCRRCGEFFLELIEKQRKVD